MPQIPVRAVYMRGGTSRAIVFRPEDLPNDKADWDPIFLAAIGSPDPNGRQLDGLGGGISSLSKVAVVGPSTRPDADVDYTFAQVAVGEPLVQYRANCGNISSAIGPFAVDEGLVRPDGSVAKVRIHNTNTGKIIVAQFPVVDGRAAVEGDFHLDGVAGTGAPIRLSFLEPGGAATGRLLPTGHAQDLLDIEGVGRIAVSLVDAANPTVFVEAAALGFTGSEHPDELAGNPKALALFEALRVAAAVRMGIVADEDEARTRTRNLPIVSLLAAPGEATTLKGSRLSAADMDIMTRMISAGQPHRATPLTAAMCLAVAVRIPGTVASRLASSDPGSEADIRVAHPSGVIPVASVVGAKDGEAFAQEAVVYRTARRLMEGAVLVPSRLVPKPADGPGA
ncbi:2-methylaconitate cis-trans isomerase PrpF family protein [Microvirga sp. M2]|uniref:2-methylaconitate cis-trans isomerase PrpF family protein n=1 Tax=Microvirga sp. M2 TaxID=3073270 RepID=UPI0039C4319E